MVTESQPPETFSEPEAGNRAQPEDKLLAEVSTVDAPVAVPEAHSPSVHEVLLETVSPDALATGGGQPVSETQPVDAQEITDAVADPDPAPVMQLPEALEAAPDAISDLASEPEAVPAAETAPAPIPAAAIETASVALAVQTTPQAILRPTRISFDMIGEITHVNATILAFLQSEGSAAVAHWQSLSSAKTPADAIRIQVDEMQRAADASLTCFSVLARRAGRLATGIGRA